MKLTGEPGMVVTKKVIRNGNIKISHLFNFDDNGNAEIDDTKYSESDLEKLSLKFKHRPNVDQIEEMPNTQKLTRIEKIEKAIIDKQKQQRVTKKPTAKKQVRKVK